MDSLSADEHERAARFRFPQDRQRWVAARSALRAVLGDTLGCPAADIVFVTNEYGKPFLAGETGLRFNLSHAGDIALLAVTEDHEVGVDIERIRDDIDIIQMAESVFALEEIDLLRQAPEEQRRALFFTLWTGKEAVVKAHGAGLSLAPESFSLTALARAGKDNVLGFTVTPLSVGSEYAAALATSAENPQIYVREWHV